jgi:hypothetical protein
VEAQETTNYHIRDINAGVADWLSQLGDLIELSPGRSLQAQHYSAESGGELKHRLTE